MNRILIKSEREYLREVFSRIENGKYAVPSFQRDFVWTEKQVMELFDSILRGYPIGAITLWHSEKLFGRKDILTDKECEDKQLDYYILDGRQRLTALYGCCVGGTNGTRDKRLSLSYNLIDSELVFAKSNDELWIVPINEIYNTFQMLVRLRKLQNSDMAEDQVVACGEKLMQINTILQEYLISEILIEKCSLQEAGEVFARINSKGTEINQMEMLQAVAFGHSSGFIMSRELKKIARKLEPYGFESLDNKTIMNCFFKYADLTFYENKAIDMATYNFEENLEDITLCLCRTASFLHNKCFVISERLLPYSRQFIALSLFFKVIKTPSKQQEKELIRWFYYTTASQSFMNGSMTNVRAIFNKFDSYIKGESEEAGNYQSINLSKELNFRVSSKSARSNLLMLTQVRKRILMDPSLINTKKISFYKLSSHPSAYFPALNAKDKSLIRDLISHNTLFIENINPIAFYLNDKALDMCHKGNIDGFEKVRTELLVDGERELLESCGLKVDSTE